MKPWYFPLFLRSVSVGRQKPPPWGERAGSPCADEIANDDHDKPQNPPSANALYHS